MARMMHRRRACVVQEDGQWLDLYSGFFSTVFFSTLLASLASLNPRPSPLSHFSLPHVTLLSGRLSLRISYLSDVG